MKIAITQEMINKGKRGKACHCPTALAFREVCPWVPRVSCQTVTFGSDVKVYELPLQVCSFIRKFDDGHPVEPMEFEMEVPT